MDRITFLAQLNSNKVLCVCAQCGEEFFRYKSVIDNGRGITCSTECQYDLIYERDRDGDLDSSLDEYFWENMLHGDE